MNTNLKPIDVLWYTQVTVLKLLTKYIHQLTEWLFVKLLTEAMEMVIWLYKKGKYVSDWLSISSW